MSVRQQRFKREADTAPGRYCAACGGVLYCYGDGTGRSWKDIYFCTEGHGYAQAFMYAAWERFDLSASPVASPDLTTQAFGELYGSCSGAVPEARIKAEIADSMARARTFALFPIGTLFGIERQEAVR